MDFTTPWLVGVSIAAQLTGVKNESLLGQVSLGRISLLPRLLPLQLLRFLSRLSIRYISGQILHRVSHAHAFLSDVSEGGTAKTRVLVVISENWIV